MESTADFRFLITKHQPSPLSKPRSIKLLSIQLNPNHPRTATQSNHSPQAFKSQMKITFWASMLTKDMTMMSSYINHPLMIKIKSNNYYLRSRKHSKE